MAAVYPVANGQGTYKTTVSGAGEHTVKCKCILSKMKIIKFKPRSETVKYTVGTPGGAAVMLDKMNVFYIGVDNPVTFLQEQDGIKHTFL